jgi:putative heme transporter
MVAALVFLVGKGHEVVDGFDLLAHPRVGWLVSAVAMQVLSLWALARLQWLFLHAADADIGTGVMAELTAAHNAITMSVPGGVAWSTAFVYDQLRRRGVERNLAGWSILSSGAVSSFCLFLLVAAGVEWTAHGPASAAKIPVALLAAIPPAGAVALVVAHRRGVTPREVSDRVARRLDGWIGKRAGKWLRKLSRDLGRYQPTRWEWARTFVAALVNWLSDLGCLVASIHAIGGRVPWPGVLIAYSLAKVAGILPITPGGLGVVEAGLSGLLVLHGMDSSRAIAATVLYRLISFWLLLPVGWSYWAFFKVRARRSDSPAEATSTG